MPASAEIAFPATRTIHLAVHQLQSGIFPGLTVLSPKRVWSLIQRLGLTNDGTTDTRGQTSPFELTLSLDDGYSELARILPDWLPQLRRPPIVFVPTAWIGKDSRWDYLYSFTRSRHLSHDEIAKLAALGVEFGSHAHTHQPLTTLPSSQLSIELGHSKEILENIVGRAVQSLAYPYGMAGEREIEAARAAGYTSAFRMHLPSAHDSPFAQGRVPVYSIDTAGSLRSKLPTHPLQPFQRALSTVIRAGSMLGSSLNARRASLTC